jgi:acyl-coenzyme A synthetase/AMP-(fatty) acid ligase
VDYRAVVASPDPVRGEIVKAFVVLQPGQAPGDELAQALQEHVKRRAPILTTFDTSITFS